jgi:VWFA-related protein
MLSRRFQARFRSLLSLALKIALIILCIPAPRARAQHDPDLPETSAVRQDSATQAVQQPEPRTTKKDNKKSNDRPEYSIRVNVPRVTLDVSVLTPDGYSVPDLTRENFRVFEDGVPQAITSFSQKEAPVTAVLLVEYSVQSQGFDSAALHACYRFAQDLKPNDWTALVLFDKNVRIALDFTQDKRALVATLDAAGIPLLREVNLFDALADTLDRVQNVEGRKYIVLIATGQDTFSKKVLEDVYKKIESAQNTVIYVLDTALGLHDNQAVNQMRTFARMTGGRVYFPTSFYEYSDAFRDVQQSMHNRYTLSYHPTHGAQNGAGAWHKIKVQVVAPANSVPGSKEDYGRKFQVIARDGYRAEKADSK